MCYSSVARVTPKTTQTMKRSHISSCLNDAALPAEQGRQILLCFRQDPLLAAVRAACYEKTADGQFLLPAQPIILLGLSEDSDISRLAYWPDTEEVGLRVLRTLDAALGQNIKGCSDLNIRLMDSMWNIVMSEKQTEKALMEDVAYLCKHFKLQTVAEMGILKKVIEDDDDKSDGTVTLSELSPHLHTIMYSRYC